MFVESWSRSMFSIPSAKHIMDTVGSTRYGGGGGRKSELRPWIAGNVHCRMAASEL